MPRFFVPPFSGEETAVTGEDGRHIARSLRMKVGEPLTLCDGLGTDYHCEITGFAGDEVFVRVVERAPSRSEPSVKVTVYQGLPKGDKMDAIVQKAVELGAWEIVPVLMRRSVSRPDAKAAVKKAARWQKIAEEAAKQSGRGILPQVLAPMEFSKAAQRAAGSADGPDRRRAARAGQRHPQAAPGGGGKDDVHHPFAPLTSAQPRGAWTTPPTQSPPAPAPRSRR